MIKLLKNPSLLDDVQIVDVGITIVANTTYIINPSEYLEWAVSDDAVTAINAGDLVVNDGIQDLSAALGIDLLDQGEDGRYWNAKKIADIEVDNTNLANGKILKYNSTSGKLEYQDDDTSAGGNVFGQDYETVYSNGASSTTSGSWQDKINNTFTGLTDGGTYIIFWHTEARFTKAEDGTDVRIRVDNSVKTGPAFRYGEKQDDEWFAWGGHCVKTLSGVTTMKVELEYRNPGEGTSSVRRSRVTIWRVA